MSYCINPNCPKPNDPLNAHNPICRNCGSALLLRGRYRVLQQLGEGGFGKTFAADDRGTPKVLKVLLQNDPKAVELFKQEVQVLSRLQHSGIPKVEPDGYFTFWPKSSKQALHCLVMEQVEGLNLQDWLAQADYQPITEEQAIFWLKQLAEILVLVHQQNYFHRDIKPSNIMLRSPQPPLIRGASQPPLIKGASQPPLIRGASQSPLIRGASQSPLIKGASQSPLIKGASQPPLIRGASQPPLIRGASQPPLIRGASQPPLIRGASQPPLIRGASQPPLIKGASQPPLLRGARGDQLVLIDFGTAREVTATYLAKVSGQQNLTAIFSAGYTPPEQFNGRAVPQSDFYAIGRTFVHLLTGKHPSDLPINPRTGNLIWLKDAPQVSESLADLIDNLMATFPGGRPQNAKIILQRLEQIERNLSLTLVPTVLIPGTVPTVLNRLAALNLQVRRLISQVLASGDSVEENRWRRLTLLAGLGGAVAVAIKLYDSFNR